MSGHRTQLYDYMGGKCRFCGRDIQDSLQRFGTANNQFEFNHIHPAKKSPEYDNLIRRKLSSSQLDELDKCVLLCRWCHGIFHAQNLRGKARVKKTIAGIKRQQTMACGGILDMQEKRLTLFSDQDDKLALFSIHLGGMPPLFRIRRELDRELFTKYIPATLQHQSLIIRGHDRRDLFRAERVTNHTYQMEVDVQCPFIELELDGEPGEHVLWVRNGVALSASGEVMREGVITCYGLNYADCPKQ